MNPTETWNVVKKTPKKTTQTGTKAYCSGQHVVHERSQTPPVHRSVVAAAHQDLWSPDEEGDRRGKDTISWIFSVEAEEAQKQQ